MTVGAGGTVEVENIAALIGALQRAGVPVELHQAHQGLHQEHEQLHQGTVLVQVRSCTRELSSCESETAAGNCSLPCTVNRYSYRAG